MLIDMAYYLRWWSRESFPRSAEIVGHLVLPEAFIVDPLLQSKLQAVAAATLEQVEYLTDMNREDVTVRYREGERTFDKLISPFNFVYLLNGSKNPGVANRKHLVQMIARAIRSMAIEPASQAIFSDANNKLTDVPRVDKVNGRRPCFASYGLRCGTPGLQQSDVDQWIFSALREGQSALSCRTMQWTKSGNLLTGSWSWTSAEEPSSSIRFSQAAMVSDSTRKERASWANDHPGQL